MLIYQPLCMLFGIVVIPVIVSCSVGSCPENAEPNGFFGTRWAYFENTMTQGDFPNSIFSVETFTADQVPDFEADDILLLLDLSFREFKTASWEFKLSPVRSAFALSCPDPEIINSMVELSVRLRLSDGGESESLSYTLYSYNPFDDEALTELSSVGSSIPNFGWGAILALDLDEQELASAPIDAVVAVTVLNSSGQSFSVESSIYR